jgi:tetratricopeptide (TPR) repeat protein
MNQLQQALRALQAGDQATASTLLSRILAQAPGQPDALQMMGVLYRQKGELTLAADCFRRSLSALPKQPMVLMNLAGTLTAMGDDVQAAVCYERTVSLDPMLADAYYNLGLIHYRHRRWDEANRSLSEAVRLQPNNGKPHEALGLVFREMNLHERAVEQATFGARLQPQSKTAHHNLGQVLLAAGDFEGAAGAYEKSLSLNPSVAASWIGLGHACRGMGRIDLSRRAYHRATELEPANADAHRLLNEMVWQTGDHDNYLVSFRQALSSKATDPRLRLSYANELLKIRQPDEARKELELVLRSVPDDGAALDAMARARSATGEFDAACGFHARALDHAPGDSMVVRNYAETLLKALAHQPAYDVTRLGRERFPLEQGVLALHTTAQRLVGDEAYARIADYAAVPKVMIVEPPAGYADIETFCIDLKAYLETLHATKAHPTDQTLRGGTQTFGALFQDKSPVIQHFVVQLRKAIADYIRDMPDDPAHPLFRRKGWDFDFSGSWSVRLSSGGFHTNHFHPMGWISSAFYVTVPDVVSVNGRHDGWLKMGETNLELGAREVIHRQIQPKVGHLALFPSYFWHGTVPFESSAPRITIAFDVVPK